MLTRLLSRVFQTHYSLDDFIIVLLGSVALIGAIVMLRDRRDRQRDKTEQKVTEKALGDSESKFRSLAENLPGVIYQYVLRSDGSHVFTYVSPGAREIYRQEPDAILHDPQCAFKAIHPDDILILQQTIVKSAQTLESWTMEYRILLPCGDMKWVQGSSRPQKCANGDIVWDGFLIDITARKQAEEDLKTIFNNVHDAIFIHDLDGSILDVNDRMLEMYQVSREQALKFSIGQDYSSLDNLKSAKFSHIREKLELGETPSFEWKAKRPLDGSVFDVEVALSKISFNHQTVILANVRDISDRKRVEQLLADYNRTLEQQVHERTLALQQEISERRRAEEVAKTAELALKQANLELGRLATLDDLTQIANRRRFDEHLLHEWRRSTREHQSLSLILCDVDYFKCYNDHYGHQGGDDCLRKIASAIEQSVRRPADLATRYGGEEFAIILPNTHAEGAAKVAEMIRAAIAQLQLPHAASPVSDLVTLSLGISSTVPTHDRLPDCLITQADEALYEAKKRGRDRVCISR